MEKRRKWKRRERRIRLRERERLYFTDVLS